VDTIGLIAGEGIFPILVARGARAAGKRVICVALSGFASEALRDEVDEFEWVGLARPGQWTRNLHRHGVTKAIMVGRVTKAKMYSRLSFLRYIPDWTATRIWLFQLRGDKRPGAMLRATANMLSEKGIELIDSTTYTKDELASKGVMTRRAPNAQQQSDIEFGLPLCQQISKMDIGQSIAVLNKDVIAVEALEGTNAMIRRAGELCKTGGWMLIKVANERQDMRMDVPTIGLRTIENLAAARAACVVLQVGKTILLERQKVLDAADRAGIAIVGIE
jgi:UDP-2,3-diacylglucosamine hydrolase